MPLVVVAVVNFSPASPRKYLNFYNVVFLVKILNFSSMPVFVIVSVDEKQCDLYNILSTTYI